MSASPAHDDPGQSVSASPTLRDEPIDLPLQEKSKENPNPEAESDDPVNDTQPPSRHNSNESTAAVHDEDVFIVDWEGPDDPENPKK